jgi:hypothetical protein
MWIKLEDKISLDVGEDNFFANELPEKITAGSLIFNLSQTDQQYLLVVEISGRLSKLQPHKMS